MEKDIQTYISLYESIFEDEIFDWNTISSFSEYSKILLTLPPDALFELVCNEFKDRKLALVTLGLFFQRGLIFGIPFIINSVSVRKIHNRFQQPAKLIKFYKELINLIARFLKETDQTPLPYLLEFGFNLCSEYINLKKKNNEMIFEDDYLCFEPFKGG